MHRLARIAVTLAILFGLALPVSAHTVPLHCGSPHGVISDGGGYGHKTTKYATSTPGLYYYFHWHYTWNAAKRTWMPHNPDSSAYCWY